MVPTSALALSALLPLFFSCSHAKKPWPKQSYKTESFNIPYFNVTRQGEATGLGDLFLGIVNPQTEDLRGPFIMEDTGDLVWHGPSEQNAYYNFQSQTIKNEPKITYWTGTLDYSGHGYGAVTVLDAKYQLERKICFPDSVVIVPPRPDVFPGNMTNPCYVDKHESLVTDRNSIIVTAYNATQTDLTAVNGPKDGWIYDCLFFELDLTTNDILFQWSAIDHVPITKSNFLGKDKTQPLKIGNKLFGQDRSAPWDYFHINSVDTIPGGGYIANSRMTWSFYGISKTGNLDWTVEGSNGGDFKLLDPIFFSWQHHPRLQGMSKNKNSLYIHLFNNDNIPQIAHGQNGSSGYWLNVNVKAKTVSTKQFLQDESIAPIYAVAEGSVQTLLNGHHLVGYGARPFVQEYDAKANVIYNAQFGRVSETTHSYRAYRKVWKGDPATPPKIVASVVNGQVEAYMSWNGATSYTKWNVYAGDTQDDLAVVDTLAKNGFETKDTFGLGSPAYQYVMAEALGSDGSSLGNSTIEAISGASGKKGTVGSIVEGVLGGGIGLA